MGRGHRRRRHATASGASPTPTPIAAVQEALADAELLIADGHHRYETARVYADEIGGEGEHRYVLMCLVALEDPGLTVFPTHRLLSGLDARRSRRRSPTRCARDFDDRPRSRADELEPPPATGRSQLGYLDAALPRAVPPDAHGPGDRRRARCRHAGALPPARHRRARGADPEGRARADRGRHLAPARPRLRARRRRGARRWSSPASTTPRSSCARRRSSRSGRSPRPARTCRRSRPTSSRRSSPGWCSTRWRRPRGRSTIELTKVIDAGDRTPRTGRFTHTIDIRHHQLTADEPHGARRRRRRARARRSCSPRAWPPAPRSRWRCTPSARAGTSATSRSTCDYAPAERGCPTRFELVMRLPATCPRSRSSACR